MNYTYGLSEFISDYSLEDRYSYVVDLLVESDEDEDEEESENIGKTVDGRLGDVVWWV